MRCGCGIGKMKKEFKMFPKIMKKPVHFENLVLEGKIILKCMLL
jgi:hypothetical protein